MVKVFVSDDKKQLQGEIKGMRKIERREGGFLITFGNYDSAYKAAKEAL